jgi:hypothetical protein
MEHPFNPGLMLEALVNQAQQAMTPASTSTSTSTSYGGWKSGLNSGH